LNISIKIKIITKVNASPKYVIINIKLFIKLLRIKSQNLKAKLFILFIKSKLKLTEIIKNIKNENNII